MSNLDSIRTRWRGIARRAGRFDLTTTPDHQLGVDVFTADAASVAADQYDHQALTAAQIHDAALMAPADIAWLLEYVTELIEQFDPEGRAGTAGLAGIDVPHHEHETWQLRRNDYPDHWYCAACGAKPLNADGTPQ